MTEGWGYAGRWGLVTGASAGIGEVFAHRLAARGMNLVLSARRLERLEGLARKLREEHAIAALAVPADLGRPGEAGRLWEEASNGRSIHLLVNNAGFGARGPFAASVLARQLEMIQVNCSSVLELAHHALRPMLDRGEGGIINVSSIAAFQPVPELATYGASKAFVLSLSQALWSETRGTGVRVLALCPGRTPTEFQAIAGTGNADSAFGVRSAGEVVDAGLQALEADRSYEVPGVENYLATLLVRVLPSSAVTRAAKALVRRDARRT